MSTTLSAPQRYPAPADESCADWKQQLAERLDAYRAKHPEEASPTSPNYHVPGDSRASEIARSVASRYAAAPTYDELLRAAAEARRAAAEAQAALAARIASDALAVREQEIAESESGPGQPSVDPSGDSPMLASGGRQEIGSEGIDQADIGPVGTEVADSPTHAISGTPVMPRFAARTREMHLHQPEPEPEPALEDLWSSALVEPRTLLPSKLIEFPRELVSSRRAKLPPPEMAGGRHVQSGVPQPEPSQLRIFEVEPSLSESVAGVRSDDIGATSAPSSGVDENVGADREPSTHPLPIKFENPALAGMSRGAASGLRRSEPPGTSARTGTYAGGFAVGDAFRGLEWAAISLDQELTAPARRPEARIADSVPFLIDRASIERRVMAFAVDFCAITAGFFAFLLIFGAATTHIPTGTTALVLGGTVYACLWVLYQMLFFSLGGATAGMLYARIALCTFDDRNPTRPALRHRVAAWWLACLPVGIGFLWCFVDEDNLGWHDRMTRTYQREY